MPVPKYNGADYDFDNFDEDEAISELVKESEVKYVIVERTFVGRFPNGKIAKLPLTLTLDLANAAEFGGDNPIDQIRGLLNTLGDEKTTNLILSQDLFAVAQFATKYFKVIEKISKASLPE